MDSQAGALPQSISTPRRESSSLCPYVGCVDSHTVVTVQIQEFTAEQADAAGVIGQYGRYVVRAADIAEHLDSLAVLRFVGLTLQLFQHFPGLPLLLHLFEQIDPGVLVRLDGHIAGNILCVYPKIFLEIAEVY